jgi:hypothetical protein
MNTRPTNERRDENILFNMNTRPTSERRDKEILFNMNKHTKLKMSNS